MAKIKIPFLSPQAFIKSAREHIDHLIPTSHKVGSPPGTLVYTGKNEIETKIRLFQYDKQDIVIQDIKHVDDLEQMISKSKINWIEVEGLYDIESVRKLGKLFDIDSLTLEDILSVSQLPKIEGDKDYEYVTLKIIELIEEEFKFTISHFSIIAKNNLIITFSESQNTIFHELNNRLQNPNSMLRKSSASYLSYRILDTIVDNYYHTLDWFTNTLSDLEFELVENQRKKHINTILTFKKKWLLLRKSIYPLKDVIRKTSHSEHRFIQSAGKQYLDDLHDHLHTIFETMEILRETLDNLMDLYNSTVSNKMNEVMKVLTIVSSIFIPLTFIAGIYGMNFANMPELSSENGYFYTLGVMAIMGFLMFLFMKKKRWF